MKLEVELPSALMADIADLKAGMNELLQKKKAISPHNVPEIDWITTAAFMQATGTKRTFFENHKHLMNTRRLNRRVYIHRNEVARYFNGEFN